MKDLTENQFWAYLWTLIAIVIAIQSITDTHKTSRQVEAESSILELEACQASCSDNGVARFAPTNTNNSTGFTCECKD